MTVRSIYTEHDSTHEAEHTAAPDYTPAAEPDEAPAEFVMPGGYLPPHMILRNRKPPDIIPGMCFESSVGVIIAPPYVGKTLLLIDLALALATGQEWLKWRPSRTVPAIVFALDSPGWESREQAECLMAGRGIVPGNQPFFLVTREDAERMRPVDPTGEIIPGAPMLGRFDIMNEAWYQHVVTVTRGAGAKLIGLDSFSKIHTLQENDRLEMEGVMKQVSRLAMETKAHVMLLHHTPVVDRSGSVYAGRGSSVIAGSVDFEAVLVKTNRTDCKIDVLKGRGSDEDGDFLIRKNRVAHPTCPRAVQWSVVPPEPPKKRTGELAWEWFQEALADGPKTREELMRLAIATQFDAPGGRKVDNYLSRFKASSLLRSSGERGKYELIS